MPSAGERLHVLGQVIEPSIAMPRGGLSSVFANYYFVSVIVPTVMGSVVCGVTVNVLPETQ